HLPVTRLWVRRLDLAQGWWETVAVAPWDRDLGDVPTRHPLDPADFEDVLAWGRRRRFEAPPNQHAARMVPRRGEGVLLAAGLVDGDQVVGLAAVEGGSSLDEHVDLLDALLDPLVVALR